MTVEFLIFPFTFLVRISKLHSMSCSIWSCILHLNLFGDILQFPQTSRCLNLWDAVMPPAASLAEHLKRCRHTSQKPNILASWEKMYAMSSPQTGCALHAESNSVCGAIFTSTCVFTQSRLVAKNVNMHVRQRGTFDRTCSSPTVSNCPSNSTGCTVNELHWKSINVLVNSSPQNIRQYTGSPSLIYEYIKDDLCIVL